MPAVSEDGGYSGRERSCQSRSGLLEGRIMISATDAAVLVFAAASGPRSPSPPTDRDGVGVEGVPGRGDGIAGSWRAVGSGARSERVAVPFDPSGDREAVLVRAARPVIDQLSVDLAGTSVSVVVTNERGQVLDRRDADASLSAHLDRVWSAPGYTDDPATNALVAAPARRRLAPVGEERVVDGLRMVACAAAPISDPRSGRVLGVIDLTSLATDASALMRPLATRAAREIEQRLLDDVGVTERLMLHRFLQERRRAKGPLVFITQHTMITNAAADRLIDTGDETILRDRANRPPSHEPGDDTPITLTNGTTVTVHREPLLDGGSPVGAMLRLEPIRDRDTRPPRRDDRPTFGWDSLTDTETSVIDLVADGLTNREAAERLFLSRHTVGFHLRSIFTKLGVRSRVELTRLALQHPNATSIWVEPATAPPAGCMLS
jgi:DNA-binding CsgD family transcriptional regulator